MRRRERENCLVHYLQTERGADAIAPSIRDVEVDRCVGTWLIDSGVSGGLDLQLIGRLDEDEPMVGNRLSIAAEEIRIDVERARHLGSGI